MRVIALAAVLFLLAVSASWGSVREVSSSATTETPLSQAKPSWRATVAKLPANAAATSKHRPVSISSISCVSPGNCTGVGSYYDKAGHPEGLLLTEKAGHWRRGVEAVLPANAVSDPEVELNSVSCASARNCTAVGTYSAAPSDIYSDGVTAGLLLTEKAGRWADGVEAVLPGNAPPDAGVILNSVSCASAGNCTAVGYYTADSDGSRGLLLTEKASQWAPGVEVESGPLGANLTSVSCASGGGCSAVGSLNGGYDFRSGVINGDGMLLSKKAGEWSAVVPIWPDAGPGEAAILISVSCASAGNCSATGLYNIGIDYSQAGSGALFTETAGIWRPGVRAKPPLNAHSPYWWNYVGLAGISCASPGNCGAVGIYYNHLKREHLTLLTETDGKWRRGVEGALPRHAHGYAEPAAISCASAGNCTVVGEYGNRTGRQHGFLLTEIAGIWARGVRTPLATTYVDSVSCTSPGNRSAVGGDSRGRGILLDSTTK